MSLPDKPIEWVSNYTRVPNEFFEIAPYLTEPELRIMLYAIRHTIGWDDKRESREAHISVSNFAKGYTLGGTHYEGTHLTEVTIRKALAKLVVYGLLEKVGGITDIGQKWRLAPKCNAAELTKRQQESYKKDQQRTISGRKKAEEKRQLEKEGLSHNKEGGYPITLEGVISQPQIKKEKEKKERKDSPHGDSRSDDAPVMANARSIVQDAFAVNQSVSVKVDDASAQPADCKSTQKLLPRPDAKAVAPSPATPPKPLMAAVCYAMNEPRGSVPGMIGKFFSGTLDKKDKKDTAWTDCQPDLSPTPELLPLQIIAFTLWYSRHDKYKSTFAEHKALPMTPRILRERWDIYMARDDTTHVYWMAQARPILERLLRGEKVSSAVALSTGNTGRVESAQAYKPIKPTLDPAYLDRRQAGDLEVAARLFGAPS